MAGQQPASSSVSVVPAAGYDFGLIKTGASTAATGTITSNADSTLTLASPSNFVVISNQSGQTAYVRLNGAVSTTVYDFVLGDGATAFISQVMVATVHVYVAATSGIRVVGW